jgi:hypothetical protein
MEATANTVKSKKKKVAKHERCAICHYPFGTGTCDSCRDPKCDSCGLRLLTAEREAGSKCANCSEDAKKSLRAASRDKTRIVAVAVTD